MTLFNRRSVIAGIGGTVIASFAGCLGDDDDDADDTADDADDDDDVDADPEDRVDDFLTDNDANLYDGSIDDQTGEGEITIDVGAGDGFAFDPAAVRIDAGTTVVWEWTGEGGDHNVAPTGDTDFDDFGDRDFHSEEGHTHEHTFDEEGVAMYVCEPHAGPGMYGAVIIE